ncbi:MAG: DNA polymerase III subunit delta [Bacillota bacterium]|nr:DNA polymerase III subunit delta [Bacillota bacterium]
MKKNSGYDELKKSIKNGGFAPFYIFYGEESYLREYSLAEIRKKTVAKDMESFNYTVLEANAVTLGSLTDAISSYPVFSEKKLVVLRDFDILKPPAAMQDGLLSLIKDLPDYICLIASYDTISFPDAKLSAAGEEIKKKAVPVNFQKQGEAELTNWVIRRFAALGKNISGKDAEYLIFVSGAYMNTLINEIEKLAAYETKEAITQKDIDTVAVKALDAQIYYLTDCITSGKADKAILIIRDLLMLRYEPVVLMGAVTRQMLRLYSAKLLTKEGRHMDELMKLWGMKSSYPAEKLLMGADGYSKEALEKSLELCAKADLQLKSTVLPKAEVLELLILNIAALMRTVK